MGQQQLLLLVIGVVLVGVAVMAGFTAADTRFQQSIADTLVEHNLSIASDAVFWKTKQDPFNGGNASYIGLGVGGLQMLAIKESTNTGTFKITCATTDHLEITSTSLRYPDIGVRTFVDDYDVSSTAVSYDGEITLEDGCSSN